MARQRKNKFKPNKGIFNGLKGFWRKKRINEGKMGFSRGRRTVKNRSKMGKWGNEMEVKMVKIARNQFAFEAAI